MDWLANIGPILSGSGLSFGGLLVLFIVMFARGILWTNNQVNTVVTNLKAELTRSNTDRDYWRDAYFDQKVRSDRYADTMSQVVPLIGGNLKIMGTIAELAEGGKADDPG